MGCSQGGKAGVRSGARTWGGCGIYNQWFVLPFCVWEVFRWAWRAVNASSQVSIDVLVWKTVPVFVQLFPINYKLCIFHITAEYKHFPRHTVHFYIYEYIFPTGFSLCQLRLLLKHFLIGAFMFFFFFFLQAPTSQIGLAAEHYFSHKLCCKNNQTWTVWRCGKVTFKSQMSERATNTHLQPVFLMSSIYFSGLPQNKPFVTVFVIITFHCQLSAWTCSWQITLPE